MRNKPCLGTLDGKVSAVVGTHTHVPTKDARVLPPMGDSLPCDVGMTGPYNGILGMERDIIITKFLNQLPARLKWLKTMKAN